MTTPIQAAIEALTRYSLAHVLGAMVPNSPSGKTFFYRCDDVLAALQAEPAQVSIDVPGWKALAEKAIEVLNRHIVPGGLSDKSALSELYGIFDGPAYRAVHIAQRAASVAGPEKTALFPITICGTPMREYATGKWENAEWPSERAASGDAPVAWRKGQYGYQTLFNAIADSVRSTQTRTMNISVEAFEKSMASATPAPIANEVVEQKLRFAIGSLVEIGRGDGEKASFARRVRDDLNNATLWQECPPAPKASSREEAEARQRDVLAKRFASRATTPATADFDLPAPNDAPRASTSVDCQECGHGPQHDPSCSVTPKASAPDAPAGEFPPPAELPKWHESTRDRLIDAAYCNGFNACRDAVIAAAAPAGHAEPVAGKAFTTDEARDYLIAFMERHFTDTTFHRYIRADGHPYPLAGDFAWQMATALRKPVAAPVAAEPAPTVPAQAGTDMRAAFERAFPGAAGSWRVDNYSTAQFRRMWQAWRAALAQHGGAK